MRYRDEAAAQIADLLSNVAPDSSIPALRRLLASAAPTNRAKLFIWANESRKALDAHTSYTPPAAQLFEGGEDQ